MNSGEMNGHGSRSYRTYVRRSTGTNFWVDVTSILLSTFYAALSVGVIALIVLLVSGTFAPKKILTVILPSGAAGAAVMWIYWFKNIRLPFKRIGDMERSEGYSERYFAMLERLLEKGHTSKYGAADAFLRVGNADRAIQILSGIDVKKFEKDPDGAHLYYAFMMKARLQKGEVQEAKRLGNEGFFYLQTYINSPLCWRKLTVSLGIFYYHVGDYYKSLEFLDRAMSVHDSKKHSLAGEFCTFEILYWMAMCYTALGEKEAALDMLDMGKGLYTTDYYRNEADKLFDELEELEIINFSDYIEQE